jgi:hypothetical protein
VGAGGGVGDAVGFGEVEGGVGEEGGGSGDEY